MISKYRNFS